MEGGEARRLHWTRRRFLAELRAEDEYLSTWFWTLVFGVWSQYSDTYNLSRSEAAGREKKP